MIAVIAAGTGGIGQALIEHLLATKTAQRIHASYHVTTPPQPLLEDSRIVWTKADLTSEADVST